MSIEVIETVGAPKPIGPYSQAVRVDKLLFCSGQVGIDPMTSVMAESVSAQAGQMLTNLKAVIEAAGSNLGQTVKTTLFLKNMSDFQVVNQVYASYFTAPYPARSTVEVAKLPRDALCEIEAIVVLS